MNHPLGISFNVHVRQEVTTATHFLQLEFVHHFSLGRFVDELFGQVNNLFSVHSARHLFFPHLAEIVFVLVSDHIATCEALDWDDHIGWLV